MGQGSVCPPGPTRLRLLTFGPADRTGACSGRWPPPLPFPGGDRGRSTSAGLGSWTGIRAQPGTAGERLARRCWRGGLPGLGRGWSKNVSYSSVFLPGPAPPLPPNKPFPIAQLADGPPARPSLGLRARPSPARLPDPQGWPPPAWGSSPVPQPQPPTSASPRERALDLNRGGPMGRGLSRGSGGDGQSPDGGRGRTHQLRGSLKSGRGAPREGRAQGWQGQRRYLSLTPLSVGGGGLSI